MLKNNPDIKLNVIGHTDRVGTLKFNEKLGLQRANAVIDYLVTNYHIEANRLIPTTRGEKDPLSSHGVESSTGEYNLGEINRRVDFQIVD
jgi:outer membrane protein OmpA-like peptidoglycan-associated protein